MISNRFAVANNPEVPGYDASKTDELASVFRR